MTCSRIMGRKWTNIRFIVEDRDKSISEASANPRTQEEALYDYLRERWDNDNVAPREHIDLMFGNPSEEKLNRWLSEVFERFEFIKEAGVVFVTDSAHIGYGKVFQRNNNTAEVIEEYSGYEGARGKDVVGMIYDDYRIKVSAEFCWD